MPVTKQVYTATATWTASQLANLFRSAFIDAGLMTEWHDTFAISGREYRVLKIEHDGTKTYGSTFYYFTFIADGNQPGVSIASGWNTSTDTPTGTQFLDYHILPTNLGNANNNNQASAISSNNYTHSSASNIALERYTSQVDTKQSWFVLRNTGNSFPMNFLHPQTTLHTWLDLSKGIISGYTLARPWTSSRTGLLSFQIPENIQRCLVYGSVLRGVTTTNGNAAFHAAGFNAINYVGVGSVSNDVANNRATIVGDAGSGTVLPVGKTSANPAFTSDYIPICTGLQWSPFTPTLLASDFAVYMHYANNTIGYGDKFVVSAGTEEWQVIAAANNGTLNDGASPVFMARVV
jgi:hypothetical protein